MKIVLLNDREPFDRSLLDNLEKNHRVIIHQHAIDAGSIKKIINENADAEILVTTYMDLSAENLALFDNLKVIIATTTAIEYIDSNYAKERGIDIINNPGYTESAVAEHLMALMMSVGRRIPSLDQQTKMGNFKQFSQIGFEFNNKTLGIIGMGNIGQRFATLARGLNMQVQFYSRSPKELGMPQVELDTLLKTSDVIALTLPSTRQTHHLIDEKALGMMKDSAILVSIAADDVIDINVLSQALAQQKLFGVGLDLHYPHPELYEFDNVVVTPTKAWYTADCMKRRTQSWLKELDEWLTNYSN